MVLSYARCQIFPAPKRSLHASNFLLAPSVANFFLAPRFHAPPGHGFSQSSLGGNFPSSAPPRHGFQLLASWPQPTDFHRPRFPFVSRNGPDNESGILLPHRALLYPSWAIEASSDCSSSISIHSAASAWILVAVITLPWSTHQLYQLDRIRDPTQFRVCFLLLVSNPSLPGCNPPW
jgi:hypothetical protein